MRAAFVSAVLGGALILLVTLKLAGAVDWSWWWITMPIWWPLSVLVMQYGVDITVGPNREAER